MRGGEGKSRNKTQTTPARGGSVVPNRVESNANPPSRPVAANAATRPTRCSSSQTPYSGIIQPGFAGQRHPGRRSCAEVNPI
eukprot:6367146-Pyramimonas_sp.AAC.1